MNEIQVTARLKIHDGKLEEVRAFAAAALRTVREKDTGTLQHDWFLSADQTECVVRERYVDSQALLDHIDHVGAQLAALPNIGSFSAELYGDPSPELLKAVGAIKADVFSYFQGL